MASDPFADLTDDELTLVTVYAKIICGRGKLAQKGQGKAAMCAVGKRLDLLRGQRGLPALTPPFQAPAKHTPFIV